MNRVNVSHTGNIETYQKIHKYTIIDYSVMFIMGLLITLSMFISMKGF